MTFFENCHVSVETALQKALKSPKPLSWEMTRILVGVIYGGYELFPSVQERDRPRAGSRDPDAP